MTFKPLPAGTRETLLQQEIARHVHQGYLVVSQTNHTAQLRRPKTFSCLWAALWFLFFGIGIVVYLIYYGAKRDDLVYVEIGIDGQVKRRGESSVSPLTWVVLGASVLLIACLGCGALGLIFNAIELPDATGLLLSIKL